MRNWIPLGFFLTACASQPPEPPQQTAPTVTRFTYGDGTARYDYIAHRTVEQEVDGQTTRTESALHFRVAVTVAQVNLTRSVQFSVDTIVEATGPGFTPAMRQAVTGIRREGVLQANGEITDFTDGTERSRLVSNITSAMKQFFPLIPIDGVEPGTEWVDTTVVVTNDGSTSITKHSVIQSVAGDWQDGGAVLPIQWRAEYTLEGEGQQLGQSFDLVGTGLTVGEHVVSAEGFYLATSARDSSFANVLLPTLGITVPVIEVGVDSVRMIR